jgi:hypothetical protein
VSLKSECKIREQIEEIRRKSISIQHKKKLFHYLNKLQTTGFYRKNNMWKKNIYESKKLLRGDILIF